MFKDRSDRKRQADSRMDPSASATPVTAGVWEHVRTFVRHRWWALAGFVLLAAPMAAITLMTTPVFEATTRVLVGEDAQRVGLGPSNQEPRSVVDSMTQTEVVRSRTLARKVVESLKLWEAPEYAPLVAAASDDTARAAGLVDPLLSHVTVALIPESRVVSLSVEAQDPALAAGIANEIAKLFIERERESKFQAANGAAQWLNERLAEQRAQVSASETALQSYRASQDAMSLLERQNIVGQKMLDLNAAVTRAKTDRLLKEAQYQQIQAIRDDPVALESHPLVAANGFVQTLRAQAAELGRQDAQLAERLGPKHPDRVQVTAALESVQARLRAEVAKVVSGIDAEYQAAIAQETGLTGALNSQKAEASALDKKGVAYAALEREAISARRFSTPCSNRPKKRSCRAPPTAAPSASSTRPSRPGHRSVRGATRVWPRPGCWGSSARWAARSAASTCGARCTRPKTSSAGSACRCWRWCRRRRPRRPIRPPGCRRCLARPSAACAPTSCWPAATLRSRATCWS